MKTKTLFFVAVIMAVGLLIFLFFAIKPLLSKYQYGGDNIRASLFSKLSMFSSFISEVNKMSELTRENIGLKDENRKLLAQLALRSELQEQNEFLYSLLALDHIPGYTANYARVFNIGLLPDGNYGMINKGESDGIREGDIVVSPAGVLIGRITNVGRISSKMALITNLDMKITVKFLDRNITAIARGVLSEGLSLDFVSQNEEITQNDRIMTNGNDEFPPGLLVGSIKTIGPNEGDLFREILVEPEFKKINIDRILILSR